MEEKKVDKKPVKKIEGKRKTTYYLVGLLVLLSMGTLVFLLKGKGRVDTIDDDSSTFIPMAWLPIWIAIFAGRKNKKEVSEKQKKILYLVVIGTIFLVLLTLALVAFRQTS